MTTESPETSESVAQPTQRESRRLIAIVFVAIVLRVVLILVRGADLRTDPDAYVAHAQALLDTGSFCVPGTEQPTAFRPPVYAVVLAAFGYFGFKFSTAAALVNLFSTAVVIIATWWTARVVGLRNMWPTVCASAVALDPMLLRYTVLPMTELLCAAFLSVAILQTLKLWYDQQADRTGLQSAIGAGLCFGLGGLCRPIIFLVCAVVTVVMAVQFVIQRYRGQGDMQNPLVRKPNGLFVVPAMVAGLVLLPWIIRNAVQFNEFVPATTHGGYTLLLANNPVFYDEVVMASGHPTWQAASLDNWQQQLQRDQAADGIDRDSEVAVDKWNYARASRNISENPSLFFRSMLFRWQRFWAVQPTISTGGTIVSWMTALWYSVAWLGLLCVTWLWLIRRQTRVHLMFWTLLSFFVVHSFYWTNARMRAPLTAVIYVLAGIGWHFLWQEIKNRTDRLVKIDPDSTNS